MFRDRKETEFDYYWLKSKDGKVVNCMKQSVTYGVDIRWSQILDFLDDKFVDLMCKRLHVNRDQLSKVPFIVSDSSQDVLSFFNVVVLDA